MIQIVTIHIFNILWNHDILLHPLFIYCFFFVVVVVFLIYGAAVE